MSIEAQDREPDFCFLGEHEYTVDSQRRVALPKVWRHADPSRNHFFLFSGRENSLQLVPSSIFYGLLDKLRKVSFADARAAIAMGTIGSLGQEVVCDRQGRFSLTPKLMAHAGIHGRALLVGAITTIQIWDPATWEERKMSSEASLDVLEAIQERPADNLTEILKNAVQR